MQFVQLLSLCVLAPVALAQSVSPSLPALPNQYDARIVCNIVNKNFTINVHEIYDQPGNRLAMGQWQSNYSTSFTDQSNVSEYTRTIYQYSTQNYFHVNQSGCFGGKIRQRGLFANQENSSAISPPSQFFEFAKQYNETYMGVQTVNGIPCNHWRANITNATLMFSMQLDYYFSVPTWTNPYANQSQIPVMLNLSGYVSTFAFNGSAPQRFFHHYYIYTHFHAGPVPFYDMHLLEVPSNLTCVGDNLTSIPYAANRCSGDDSSSTSGGIVAGFAILALALIGVIVYVVIVNKKNGSSDSEGSKIKSKAFVNPHMETDDQDGASDDENENDTEA